MLRSIKHIQKRLCGVLRDTTMPRLSRMIMTSGLCGANKTNHSQSRML